MSADVLTERDLINRLDRLEPSVNDIQKRVVALERSDAIADVHRVNVEKRLSAIEQSLNRLVWLIVGVMVSGLGAFILQGGLQIGP